MAEHKQDETFKVIDRRLFTAEGDLRPEAAEEERREKSRAAEPAKPAPAASAGKAAVAPRATEAPAAKPAPEAPSRNFQMLVELLGRNTAVLLGAVPDPATGQAYLDLEGAREMIDMLDTLREKTSGNLHAEEESLLSEVLGNLKLSYMEISKAAAKAMREEAKGKR